MLGGEKGEQRGPIQPSGLGIMLPESEEGKIPGEQEEEEGCMYLLVIGKREAAPLGCWVCMRPFPRLRTWQFWGLMGVGRGLQGLGGCWCPAAGCSSVSDAHRQWGVPCFSAVLSNQIMQCLSSGSTAGLGSLK